jgi:choline dehydrogenase-like flavoprotein
MPLGFGRVAANPRLMWYYPTEPEAGTGGHARVWLRGKTLGGSSSVNGMVYCRGQPRDYDDWEAGGAAGWGWDSFLKSFVAIEDHELGADPWRGVGGPLHISMQRYRTPVTEAILAGCAALGTPVKADINRPDHEGVGYSPLTIKNGHRVSSAEAFLKPVRRRRNLTVLTEAVAERILFDGCRAIGVRVATKSGTREFRAVREVILSAGVIASPKILQLSGIGPAAHLSALGIPVVKDSPGVGQNLSEHKAVWQEYQLNVPYSHNRNLRGWRLAINALRYAMFRSGPLATSVDINGFIRTTSDLDRTDAQISFWSLTAVKNAARLQTESFPAIMAGAWMLRPQSRGSITIRSRDPSDHPLIRPNFLTAAYDRQVLIGAFRYLRRLFAQPQIAAFVAKETVPGAQIQSDADILAAAGPAENGYHATGTCKMGIDALSVVDPRLCVHGMTGLRVVDCSVMPTQVSSGVNGPVMALAWRAAELIADDNRAR